MVSNWNNRLDQMKEAFVASFICDPEYLITAPGRVELGGNHTDHQQGRVLAAAIDLDSCALVSKRADNAIKIVSEGYQPIDIDLSAIDNCKIHGTSLALTAGVAKAIKDAGYSIGGFNAYIRSDVPGGSGLSSSASFEVLIGTVFNALYNDSQISAVDIARFGQFAENVFFGKPSGLMDQLACSVGGINAIDFEDVNNPKITNVDFDFSNSDHSVFVVSSGADHADLTSDYAAITEDMSKVCEYFGKKVLRQVPHSSLNASFENVRASAGDRAVMRAMHFYSENERVVYQTNALIEGRIDDFLKLANESGRSSWMLLQNVLPADQKSHNLALTLAVCESILGGSGACRVHGGGFAGAALAIVPKDREEEFIKKSEQLLGRGVLTKINVRPIGPETIKLR